MITEVFSEHACPNRARDIIFNGTLAALKLQFHGLDYLVFEFRPDTWAMWDETKPKHCSHCTRLFGDLTR